MGFFSRGMLVEQVATTATAAGTTTLSATSFQIQYFTGTSTQTVKLPPTTNMTVGQFFEIYNASTGSLTMQYQDGSSFSPSSVSSNTSLVVKLTSTGTTNGTWAVQASGGTVTSVALSAPAFLSVSGSPVTTNGTLALNFSGSALPIANGGTGGTSLTSGGTGGAGSPALSSGSYTPTYGNFTNISSCAGDLVWGRVGNYVTVSGSIVFTNTASQGNMTITIPVVASGTPNGGGTGISTDNAAYGAGVAGITPSGINTVTCFFQSLPFIGGQVMAIHFSYLVN